MSNVGEYSVETRNRFQLVLDDDDADVFDILKQEEAKSEQKKTKNQKETDVNKIAKNAKQEKKDKSKKLEQKIDTAIVNNVNNMQSKISGRSNANRPHGRQSNEQHKPDNFEKAPQEQRSGNFGGRGARRGGSAGFRGGRGGPRKYDRHSGSERTGVKAVEKKEGSGSHNWGSEIKSQLDGSVREDSQGEGDEKAGGDNLTINEGETMGVDDERADEQEEPKEMTLDEWKAAQANSRTKQTFNVRRPGEGEDPKQWKNAIALEPRRRAESTESSEEHDEEAHDKVEDTKTALNKLNIQIKFSNSDSSRGSPNRGRGRGNFSGGRSDRPPRSGGFGGRPPRRGRGDYGGFHQSNRQQNSAPIVDNELEFPSLGSK